MYQKGLWVLITASKNFDFFVVLAPWQRPSETAMSLWVRLRRFRGRRQPGSGAFEAMRCSVQSGRRIQRISETLEVGWSSGAQSARSLL